jgi:hypothetical protein
MKVKQTRNLWFIHTFYPGAKHRRQWRIKRMKPCKRSLYHHQITLDFWDQMVLNVEIKYRF